MAVRIPGLTPPEGATVAIHIELTARANITPFVARQKATEFVVRDISSQLRGAAPDLHISDRLRWSVPIELTFPDRGVVGCVGELLVDATTGEVVADAATVQRIADHAEQLARRAVV